MFISSSHKRKLMNEFSVKNWELIKLLKIRGIVQQQVYQSRVHNIDELKQRLELTRPSLNLHLTGGMGVFGHMCGQKTNNSSNYCGSIQPHDNRCFSFCQKWHDFLKIFCKLPQIRTYRFRTVLRQHTEGRVYHHSMMGSIIRVLLEISSSLKNRLRIDKVIAMSILLFCGTQCSFLGPTFGLQDTGTPNLTLTLKSPAWKTHISMRPCLLCSAID